MTKVTQTNRIIASDDKSDANKQKPGMNAYPIELRNQFTKYFSISTLKSVAIDDILKILYSLEIFQLQNYETRPTTEKHYDVLKYLRKFALCYLSKENGKGVQEDEGVQEDGTVEEIEKKKRSAARRASLRKHMIPFVDRVNENHELNFKFGDLQYDYQYYENESKKRKQQQSNTTIAEERLSMADDDESIDDVGGVETVTRNDRINDKKGDADDMDVDNWSDADDGVGDENGDAVNDNNNDNDDAGETRITKSTKKKSRKSTKYKTPYLYLFLDMSMSRTYIDKCKGGYQRVDLETGQLSRQETARGSLTWRYNSIVPNNATMIYLLEGESKRNAQIKEKFFFEHIHAIHHPTNLDESNLQEAINRWEKQDFHTVSASIDFLKSSLPIISKKLLSIDNIKYKADITALDENVSGLMVEIENFKRDLGKLYGVSTNNTGSVGLPGQVRRLIQAYFII